MAKPPDVEGIKNMIKTSQTIAEALSMHVEELSFKNIDGLEDFEARLREGQTDLYRFIGGLERALEQLP